MIGEDGESEQPENTMAQTIIQVANYRKHNAEE